MKKLTFSLAIVLLLALSAGTVHAAPAEVIFFPGPGADNCFLGWLADSESGFVFIKGTGGINVDTGSTPTITTLTCRTRIEFGSTVHTTDLVTGEEGDYRLFTHQEVCAVLPDACNGNNGASIFTIENTGETCSSRDRPTTQWQEVVEPSGQATIVCHFRN